MDNAVASAIEGQSPRPPTSFLGWIFLEVLGFYGLMIFVAAALSFVLTWILIRRGRGHLMGTSLVLIVPFPFLVSLIGALAAAGVVGIDLGNRLLPIDIANDIARAIFGPIIGLMFMIPSFVLALVNMYRRATTATWSGR